MEDEIIIPFTAVSGKSRGTNFCSWNRLQEILRFEGTLRHDECIHHLIADKTGITFHIQAKHPSTGSES